MKNIFILFLLALIAFPAFAQAQMQAAKHVKQISLDANHKIVLTEKPAESTALQFNISHFDMGNAEKTQQVFGQRLHVDYASKTATLRIPDKALQNPDMTLEKLNTRLAKMAQHWEKQAEMIRSGNMPEQKLKKKLNLK